MYHSAFSDWDLFEHSWVIFEVTLQSTHWSDIFNVFFFYISEDNVDLLREMGGVTFVYNLSKSSIVHSDVKETALFTLCTLAEANGRHVCVRGLHVRMIVQNTFPLKKNQISWT